MFRIREAREARGWTQEELANAVGTTQQTVQRWETGQVNPKVSKMLEISEALGITVSFLLGQNEGLPDSPLSADEFELVHIYSHLSDHGKAVLLATARALRE